MRKWSWFRTLLGPRRTATHRPWQAGQYVTYFLEREDRTWTAFAIRVLGQTDTGAWILSGDFKTASGECTAWFRCDPVPPPDAPDILPGRVESIRVAPGASGGERQMSDDPVHQTTMAMNILLLRRWTPALAALRQRPGGVRYPCGIDHAHRYVMPGPPYAKHYDLHPDVLVTGVACLFMDGGTNPITATSFGVADRSDGEPLSYRDFIDFTHLKAVDHGDFMLTYPAVWFLRAKPGEANAEGPSSLYRTVAGGNTCSVSLSVSVDRCAPGDAERRVEERLASVKRRWAGPLGGGRSPLPPEALPLAANGKAYIFTSENPHIEGVERVAVFRSESGDRVADVSTFGCVSKNNPRAAAMLQQMRDTFREIVESFRFNP